MNASLALGQRRKIGKLLAIELGSLARVVRLQVRKRVLNEPLAAACVGWSAVLESAAGAGRRIGTINRIATPAEIRVAARGDFMTSLFKLRVRWDRWPAQSSARTAPSGRGQTANLTPRLQSVGTNETSSVSNQP